jgi:cytochrome c biogenesis protein CcdA
MGASFAIGCLSCFSATVLSALLMYAGSTGSPITGAILLFLFSSGVGLVFLLAAWLVGEATPLMGWLERAQPVVGGISALIMVGFGMLMVTYQFHVVSGFLFRLFSIG